MDDETPPTPPANVISPVVGEYLETCMPIAMHVSITVIASTGVGATVRSSGIRSPLCSLTQISFGRRQVKATKSCKKEIQQAWDDFPNVPGLTGFMPDLGSRSIDLYCRANAKCRINGRRQSEDDGLIVDSETKLTPVPLPDTAFGEAACHDTVTFSNHVCRCHDLLCKLGRCNAERNDCDDKSS